ncbi:hypothetical protein HDU78_011756 [Chytriomyces hyalinus]|nr:hypothetical protein HDU78_011756 [Chytriomyces hyalinus]
MATMSQFDEEVSSEICGFEDVVDAEPVDGEDAKDSQDCLKEFINNIFDEGRGSGLSIPQYALLSIIVGLVIEISFTGIITITLCVLRKESKN